MIFVDDKRLLSGRQRLLVFSYSGYLKSYYIQNNTFILQHCFEFRTAAHITLPLIACVEYLPEHQLLLVASQCDLSHTTVDGAHKCNGITAWRILSESPHYKPTGEGISDTESKPWLMTKLSKMKALANWNNNHRDSIYMMRKSPCNKLLAVVHCTNLISIFSLPSLRLIKDFPLDLQPLFNKINDKLVQNINKRKLYKDNLRSFDVISIDWWSSDALIVGRSSGNVTILSNLTDSNEDVQNMIGEDAEFFLPGSLIHSEGRNDDLLILECHIRLQSIDHVEEEEEEDKILVSASPSLESTASRNDQTEDHSTSSDDGSSSEEETDKAKVGGNSSDLSVSEGARGGVFTSYQWKQLLHTILYYITDSKRFRPKRNHAKFVKKYYRMLKFASITPDELYMRKILDEEYGEALMLAQDYGLNADKVYQQQYCSQTVTVISIRDYLTKIKDRRWIVNECVDKTLESFEAMRALLDYGLSGSDISAMVSKHIDVFSTEELCRDKPQGDEEEYLSLETNNKHINPRMVDKNTKQIIESVDFTNLSIEQKILMRSRLRLLFYSDRLTTYEMLLSKTGDCRDTYSRDEFTSFRKENSLQLAIRYARIANVAAVENILLYNLRSLQKYRFIIVVNFPESLCPSEYSFLLPKWSTKDESMVPLQSLSHREPDWSEQKSGIVFPNEDFNEIPMENELFDKTNEQFRKFCVNGTEIDEADLTEWYTQRALQIVDKSAMCKVALRLVQYGIELGVKKLDDLRRDLSTMDLLVYTCGIMNFYDFKRLQLMSILDKVRLVMSKSTPDKFVVNLHHLVIPFLDDNTSHHKDIAEDISESQIVLADYVISLAKDDLHLCWKVFCASKPNVSPRVFTNDEFTVKTAISCIYQNKSEKEMQLANDITREVTRFQDKENTPERTELTSKLDKLTNQIQAAAILLRHNCFMPYIDIDRMQDDEDEVVELLKKITEYAIQINHPYKQRDWDQLRSDFLRLRELVFSTVSVSVCLKIYIEGLLSTNNVDLINLSVPYLTPTQTETYDDKAQISYDVSVEIVLSAARGYFNCSSDANSDTITLARVCLALLKKSPTAIKDEIDMIESIRLIEEFNVYVLPIKVRRCKDRISLIKLILTEKKSAYKNSSQIIWLAHLLRIHADDEVKQSGSVLELLAKHALEKKDEKLCLVYCNKMMELNYKPAWSMCYNLARDLETEMNVNTRLKMLNFSLCYGDERHLNEIMNKRLSIEAEILVACHRDSSQSATSGGGEPKNTEMGSGFVPFAEITDSGTVTSDAIEQTKKILASTNKATRKALTSMASSSWWHENLIQPGTTMLSEIQADILEGDGPMESEQQSNEDDDKSNDLFLRQGCHPFYSSLMPECYNDQNIYSMDKGRVNQNNRLISLHHTMGVDYDHQAPFIELLEKQAKNTLKRDTNLGLAYFLSLPDTDVVTDYLDTLPKSLLSLELSVYYYSVKIYERYCQQGEPPVRVALSRGYNSSNIVREATSYAEDTISKATPFSTDDDEVKLCRNLVQCSVKVTDFQQADHLNTLDIGVDTERFCFDVHYREETILGLAMSMDDKTYEFSQSLAKRYDVSMWEVSMTQVESQFDSSPDLAATLKPTNDIIVSLLLEPEQFVSRMEKCVLPIIDGRSHDELLNYYSLMASTDIKTHSITPQHHIKLLRKIKTIASNFNYKNMFTKSAIQEVVKVFNSGNVKAFAKLAERMPTQESPAFLHASLVIAEYINCLFWNPKVVTVTVSKDINSNKVDYLDRYDLCSQYMPHLLPNHLLDITDNMIFSQQSIDEIESSTRIEILKRICKFSNQQVINKCKTEICEYCQITWSEVAQKLEVSLTNLKSVNNETLKHLRASNDPRLRTYANQYEIAQSDSDMLIKLLRRLVIEGADIAVVNNLLAASPVLENITLNSLVTDTITACVAIMCGEEHSLNDDISDIITASSNGIDILETAFRGIKQFAQTEDSDFSIHNLLSSVRDIYRKNISSDPRSVKGHLIALVDVTFNLLPLDDLLLLSYFHSKITVSEYWPELELEYSYFEQPGILDRFLGHAHLPAHFRCVADLIDKWSNPSRRMPVMELMSALSEGLEADTDSWYYTLVEAMAKHAPQFRSDQGLIELFERHYESWNEQEIVHLLTLMRDSEQKNDSNRETLTSGEFNCAVCTLTCGFSNNYDVVAQIFREISDFDEFEMCQLYKLIGTKHKVCEYLHYPIFKPLMEFVRSQCGAPNPSPCYSYVVKAIESLERIDLVAEAAFLKALNTSTDPLLNTFTRSLLPYAAKF